jgi:esterase
VVGDPPPGVDVHVVSATKSDAIGAEGAKRIREAGERTGRVHLHEVEGGHWLNADNPNALVDLLVGTLS